MGGGAWKVAYADFVTALMALFMVLWIVSQDEEIVIKTVEYFKDPFGVGFQDADKGSMNDNSDSNGQSFTQDENEEAKTTMVDLAHLHKLANEYYEKLNLDESPEAEKKPIKVDVIPDGVRITIFNDDDRRIFKKDTYELTEWGTYVLQNVAWVIDRNTMKLNIDSHTPHGYTLASEKYGPWELTADRSNHARRMLESFSLDPGRIHRVSGFADTEPLPELDPTLGANDRLEISLKIE